MKKIHKDIAGLAMALYALSVMGNAMLHFREYSKGKYESEKIHYSDAMKSEWVKYSENELKELKSPKLLVPFSALSSLEKRPLEIRVIIVPLPAMPVPEIPYFEIPVEYDLTETL